MSFYYLNLLILRIYPNNCNQHHDCFDTFLPIDPETYLKKHRNFTS